MIYYSSKEPFNFKTFKTIRSLGENIYSGKIKMNEADQEQTDLKEHISNFNNKARPKNRDDKKKTRKMLLILQKICDGRELVINVFKSGLFPLKSKTGTGLKILTPK